MFRFQKSLDVITLFHKPSVPASLRVLTLLKQISAQASETATEDQASDHTHQNKLQRTEFELNITEDPPTTDQMRTILEYMGAHNAGRLVEGAKDIRDAINKLGENPKTFKPPVTVDWNNGRAVDGDNESEIMKMIARLPKETSSV
ncbi:thioredoxin-like protein [Usnea florida]